MRHMKKLRIRNSNKKTSHDRVPIRRPVVEGYTLQSPQLAVVDNTQRAYSVAMYSASSSVQSRGSKPAARTLERSRSEWVGLGAIGPSAEA